MKRKRRRQSEPTDAQKDKEIADFMEWLSLMGYHLKAPDTNGDGGGIANADGLILSREPIIAAYSLDVARGWKPMNKEFLRLAAADVAKRFPDGWGFILLASPFGTGGRVVYASNCDRSDAIKTLKEFLFNQGEAADWMKHIK